MPERAEPELATLVHEIPKAGDWLYEIKYDGYRILARVDGGDVKLYTRRGKDWSGVFSGIAGALRDAGMGQAWLDGEVVALRSDGTTSFQDLQNVLALGAKNGLTYYVFDITYLDGYDLTGSPLIERKKLLRELLDNARHPIRFGDHVGGSGQAFYEEACRYGLEGVMAKAAGSAYRPGRGRSWLKIKCMLRQEFVIGGYTGPSGSRTGFGALLLGYYGEGGLVFSGRVGTGFSEETLITLHGRLRGMEQDAPPFINPPKGVEARGVRWVRPGLVAEVRFAGWTDAGLLRQPSFQGLREDKDAHEVVLEQKEMKDRAKSPQAPKIRLTNPGRVLYPDPGLTKKEIAEYYQTAAELMLPHLSGRPLTLVRCPNGYGDCFYQKHANRTVPKAVKRIEITEDGEKAKYMMVDSVEGLLSLVQMGVLEIHTWGSHAGKVEHPDRITFDIDPDPSVPWEKVAEAAFLLRDTLAALGLKSFLKTTGGKGLHVVAPVEPEHGWEKVKAFTKAVAEDMVRGHPGRFTSKMTKSRRAGRIFIDYMRNMRGATAIEAYSTRAKPGAPLAVPVGWEEIEKRVRPGSFTVRNISQRLEGHFRDPWKDYLTTRQSILLNRFHAERAP